MSSAAPAGAGSCSPDDALLAEVEAFITAEFGKVTEKQSRTDCSGLKRVLEAGLVDAAAESPVKRAMGGVWLEATRNSKVKGGRGSKGSIRKLWTQETTSILKKLVVSADKAGD